MNSSTVESQRTPLCHLLPRADCLRATECEEHRVMARLRVQTPPTTRICIRLVAKHRKRQRKILEYGELLQQCDCCSHLSSAQPRGSIVNVPETHSKFKHSVWIPGKRRRTHAHVSWLLRGRLPRRKREADSRRRVCSLAPWNERSCVTVSSRG